MTGLMYYLVLFSSIEPTLQSLMNDYGLGLCAETSDPRQFCQAPMIVTWQMVGIVFPLIIFTLLIVPTILYVTVLNVWNAKKGMRVMDHAILSIFPIFTNLYFNLKPDIQTDAPGRSESLEWRASTRSHSAPNISISANKGALRKRFCTY